MTTSHLELQQTMLQSTQKQPEQLIETQENLIPVNSIDTTELVKSGGSNVATILAISILILSLAELLKVFVPVMMNKSK